MNNIRAIQKLNQRELEEGITPEGSWHTDYRDTAFINIGGLPFELSEGDIITLFSQFGEPVWIKLARDKETGKSRGFCWLKYEDQRSTDLAVDNLGGATIMGRVLRVDHTRYKPRDDEDMRDNTMGEPPMEEDDKVRTRRRASESESESESEDERPLLPEEIALAKLINDLNDDDPMKASMVKRKQEDVDVAVRKYEKARRKEKKEKHRSRRDRRDDSRDRDRDRERRKLKDRNDHAEDRDRERRHHHRSERQRTPEHKERRRNRDSDGEDGDRRHKARYRGSSKDRYNRNERDSPDRRRRRHSSTEDEHRRSRQRNHSPKKDDKHH